MFTGIIESLGRIEKILSDGGNKVFTVHSDISDELKIDQSLSHNGVCLTVTKLGDKNHEVVAIHETLQKSNLSQWTEDSLVNLERSLTLENRLDGHLVQGHVDCTTRCLEVVDEDGSWRFTFALPSAYRHLVVDKGSIAINGVSLTIILDEEDQFQVAIIPYTFEHTSFNQIRKGDLVNIEFDIIGKYIDRLSQSYLKP